MKKYLIYLTRIYKENIENCKVLTSSEYFCKMTIENFIFETTMLQHCQTDLKAKISLYNNRNGHYELIKEYRF